MIDEAQLERLLGEAGGAVAVPTDGPARIRAARAASAPSVRRVPGRAHRSGRAHPADGAHPVGRSRLAERAQLAERAHLAEQSSESERGAVDGEDSQARPGHISAPGGWSRRIGAGALAVAAVIGLVLVAGSLAGGSRHGPTAASGTATLAGPAKANSSGAGAKSIAAGATGSATGQKSAGASVAGAPGLPSGALAPFATAGPAPAPVPAAPATGPNEVPALPTRVVKTGQVSLQVPVGQVPAVIGALSADAGGLGGYVASSAAADSMPGTPATGDVTLRVPVAAFDTLVADVRRAGKATSVSTAGQDVTSQYVDLQARIDSLTATRTQYQQILAKAQSIGDILSVESQLSDVQTQIEQLQGQLQVLEDQSSYSTLSVHVAEAPAVAPAPVHHASPSGLSKAWSHAGAAFSSGIDSVVGALGGIGVFLLTVGAIAIVARIGWVVTRRRLY